MGISKPKMLATRLAHAWTAVRTTQIAQRTGALTSNIAETVGSKNLILLPNLSSKRMSNAS